MMRHSYHAIGFDISLMNIMLLVSDKKAPEPGTIMWCTYDDRKVTVADWNTEGHPNALVYWIDDKGDRHQQSIPKIYLKPIS